MAAEAPGSDGAAQRYAGAVVRLRWWVIGFWLLSAAASVLLLPSLSASSASESVRDLLPEETPAVQNEQRSVEVFGFPLLGRSALVLRDPAGLSPATQAKTVRTAAVSRTRDCSAGHCPSPTPSGCSPRPPNAAPLR